MRDRQKKIAVLTKRRDHLKNRIAMNLKPTDLSYDKQEASALDCAIAALDILEEVDSFVYCARCGAKCSKSDAPPNREKEIA